ncbi:MAG TPA: tRNA pseudouridine(38-40) synthase TruA [Tissierellaceae bacterium]|nr:tRNA pseudouridine(38-40) synthase TruA [Tissierellaceae bacterium]
MRNIKLIIEYDGTNYSGWQRQNDVITIQETIENAIKRITSEEIKLIASGRTDKKVHALGQVANFFTDSNIPGANFKFCLNIELPKDVQIIESEEVPIDFHSRFDAKRKKYRYLIYNNRISSPIYRNYSCHVIRNLDIDEMKKSISYFIGTHDFRSFMGPKSDIDTSIRTIYNMEIIKDGKFIEINIEGNSFLRHMIRIIVGTLIYIGLGKIKKEEIKYMLNNKNRILAGPTAPAQGLFLEKVFYE